MLRVGTPAVGWRASKRSGHPESQAGQARLLPTLTHAVSDQLKAMIANVREGLDQVLAVAETGPLAGPDLLHRG